MELIRVLFLLTVDFKCMAQYDLCKV